METLTKGADKQIQWTADEDAHLLKLRRAGYTNDQIAESVGRPRSTVAKRIVILVDRHRLTASADEQPVLRSKPIGPAPVFPKEKSSPARRCWTPEEDHLITDLRRQGLSYVVIGELVGRGYTSVFCRLQKLSEYRFVYPPAPQKAAESGFSKKYGPSRVEWPHRPPGPAPSKPDPSPDPRAPAWRKCLGDGCGKVWWSPSAAVRICPACKRSLSRVDHHHDGRAVANTTEYRLHL